MCGLAGIISTEKPTKFNVNHFNILGSLNDERGGDSCGIFIDGMTDYGIGKTELFRNFTYDKKYPPTASIALLHCRKASPGYPVNIKQAQPIIMKDNDEIKFVLMHNGTITNIKKLAEKYIPEENNVGLSDSQILTKIIYYKGFDVLSEYEGAAVLIMIDYREEKPRILMFKGSSCYNDNGSDSERPLYFMVKDEKFYFSSMFSSLHCIDNQQTIYDFPVNQLIEINETKIYNILDVDRKSLKKTSQVYYNYDYNNKSYNQVICNKQSGLYSYCGKPAHGSLLLYPSGYLALNEKDKYAQVLKYWFYEGRLLYNEQCFKLLEDICDLFDDDTIPLFCPSVIDYFAYTPRKVGEQMCFVNDKFEYVAYQNGEYTTLFNLPDRVKYENGNKKIYYSSSSEATSNFAKISHDKKFDFNKLEQDILRYITFKITDLDAVQ